LRVYGSRLGGPALGLPAPIARGLDAALELVDRMPAGFRAPLGLVPQAALLEQLGSIAGSW
jgi:hypothetical protein